jgi:hypothetical protein
MDKIEVILTILMVIILALTALTLAYSNQAPNKEPLDYHSWTKAICDKDNFCQDYEIQCKGQELVSMAPITGAFIQQDANWQDPRTFEQKTRVCD